MKDSLLTTSVFELMLLERVALEDKSAAVKASSLGLSDLSAVKKSLDEEIEQLTTAFSTLRSAHAKFRECLKAVINGVEMVENGTHILLQRWIFSRRSLSPVQLYRLFQQSLTSNFSSRNGDQTILIPLTTSLYVPGKLRDREHVIVEVGTGFYVEKVCDMSGKAMFWLCFCVSPSASLPSYDFIVVANSVLCPQLRYLPVWRDSRESHDRMIGRDRERPRINS